VVKHFEESYFFVIPAWKIKFSPTIGVLNTGGNNAVTPNQ